MREGGRGDPQGVAANQLTLRGEGSVDLTLA